MSRSRKSRYQETLLQWIWDMQQFEHRNLKTVCGKALVVEDPGSLNPGKGPDFLHARLKAGEMVWHGDVEIHDAEREWVQHKHHRDTRYDTVVLHVFLRGGNFIPRTSDGFKPYRLNLTGYIRQPLYRILIQKEANEVLPCSGNLTFISEKAFEQQLIKVHHEYFEYKVESLLSDYPSGKKLSAAWKAAVITGIYKTLGISDNRDAMAQLSRRLTEAGSYPEAFDEFLEYVISLADTENKSVWKSTGMRPSARPSKRIRQAAAYHYQIQNMIFREFASNGVRTWDMITNRIQKQYLPGKQMQEILKITVFLPALYLLGDLLFSESLKHESKTLWLNSKFRLPKKILDPFQKSGFPLQNNQQNPGLAHQLKRYCWQRNCHQCEVFKKSIHS